MLPVSNAARRIAVSRVMVCHASKLTGSGINQRKRDTVAGPHLAVGSEVGGAVGSRDGVGVGLAVGDAVVGESLGDAEGAGVGDGIGLRTHVKLVRLSLRRQTTPSSSHTPSPYPAFSLPRRISRIPPTPAPGCPSPTPQGACRFARYA